MALGAEAGAAEGAVVAREAAAAAVAGLGEASEHLRQKEVAVAVEVGLGLLARSFQRPRCVGLAL